eukprot:GSChrysophyteH2.ASY1.ANO1.640.1 assembled CDS
MPFKPGPCTSSSVVKSEAASNPVNKSELVPYALVPKSKRIKNGKYLDENGEICIWHRTITTGRWHCKHDKQRNKCLVCGGASICDHGKYKSHCRVCGGAAICEHNKKRSRCIDCGGASICVHGRKRVTCTECRESHFCEHGRDCGGGEICEHNKEKNFCTDCGGAGICVHHRRRAACRECAAGGVIFEAFDILSTLKFCKSD